MARIIDHSICAPSQVVTAVELEGLTGLPARLWSVSGRIGAAGSGGGALPVGRRGVTVFHAGTVGDDEGDLVTAGGRVLGVMARPIAGISAGAFG